MKPGLNPGMIEIPQTRLTVWKLSVFQCNTRKEKKHVGLISINGLIRAKSDMPKGHTQNFSKQKIYSYDLGIIITFLRLLLDTV